MSQNLDMNSFSGFKEFNKKFNEKREEVLDNMLEYYIFAEQTGNTYPSLKDIALSTKTSYYVVRAKLALKKLKYKMTSIF